MKKSRGIAVLVLVLAITVLMGFTAGIGWGPTGTGSARNIKTGLDLSGGVSITYQTKDSNPSAEDMSDTIYKLQKRVEQYSTESQVYKEGTDRITVEIPGVTDANAILEQLGKPGSLYFIVQEDADGNSNFEYDSASGEYVLSRDIEEIKAADCIVLEGSDVDTAEGGATTDSTTQARQYIVELTLNSAGTTKFADATAANVGNQIAIVYDNAVLSAPRVNEAIGGGRAQITGMSSVEEAQNLASSIRIGSLSLELEEIRSSVVAAQLGSEAIRTSLIAGIIGLIIIIIFMIIAYRVPGFVAGISLIIYTLLILLTLNAFDITLTLPGIAGIILGIGMAVDANVIIYARIKEEIADGNSVKLSIRTGFQKAFWAIFDGNITTLIAAFVLMRLGTGTVKGFAYTLAMGNIFSMFTALVVSRLIMNAVFALGVTDEKYYGRARENKIIDFVGKRKIFFIISLILILLGPAFMLIHNSTDGSILNYSLEFSGGTSTTVTFNEDMDMTTLDGEVADAVRKATGVTTVQNTKVVGSNQVVIKTPSLDITQREALNQALVDNYGVDETLIQTENISSTVSSEMRRDAVVAVIVATICMLIYIWIRFRDIQFASSAVLALLHDVLVVLAFYAISRTSIGNTFIACMLTIVGYSINATIVIFDRIRENLKGRKKSLSELAMIVNESITQTLTRSVYTSFTTFVMVFVLWILGVASIREFAMPLMVGVICGGYSSVCITGALWLVLKKLFSKEEGQVKIEKKPAQTENNKAAQKEKASKQAPAQTPTKEKKKKNRKRDAERLARAQAEQNKDNQ